MSDTATAPAKANPAKKVHLLVTVGTDDERTMDQFETDLKAALEGSAKNITVLLSKYLVNGEEIMRHVYEKDADSKEAEDGEDD